MVDNDVVQYGLPSSRKVDRNGYVTIERNPISRAGVFQYLGKSIGAPEPERVYNVYRPAEELTHPDALESFKLLPLVDDHAMLGAQELPAEQKGVHGTTGDEVTFENDVLYANLKIFSNFLLDMLRRGKKDLSLGYRCVYEKCAGIFKGQTYDYIQRKIRGNHLALVDEARCAVAVLDQHIALDHFDLALDLKEFKMADENKKEGETKKEMTLSEVTALLAEIMPKIDALLKAKDSVAAANAEGEGTDPALDRIEATAAGGSKGVTDEDDKEKEKEKEKDKKAEDAKTEADKEEKKSMDAAIVKKLDDLSGDVSGMKKGLVKEILGHVTQRDALADKLSIHIGTFDHADKTLAEVAKYGAEKLGLKCPDGQEITAIDAYLHNRSVASAGFGFDSAQSGGTGKLDKFLSDKR